ncbi:hypothetical protein [Microvirga lotononidis]|uniref:Integral membrane protein n=1 Tax=Microvirga lotononidis TaxID=864069 RepID=I4YW86_9HYPH|nr:hypothetical protein [Microvirga lotononidis]EIM28228.1 hypothetical protein MicloDRAFT_00048070 [Microvirga lotononidis]WQO27675.1 hypothetical protein U0023_00760 [Microvirga lotononidis]
MKVSGASSGKVISRLGAIKALAALAVVLGVAIAADQAQAGHAGHGAAAKPERQAAAKVATTDVETTSSIETKPSTDDACSISRKRLFVEGEGWIVRRVTTCY